MSEQARISWSVVLVQTIFTWKLKASSGWQLIRPLLGRVAVPQMLHNTSESPPRSACEPLMSRLNSWSNWMNESRQYSVLRREGCRIKVHWESSFPGSVDPLNERLMLHPMSAKVVFPNRIPSGSTSYWAASQKCSNQRTAACPLQRKQQSSVSQNKVITTSTSDFSQSSSWARLTTNLPSTVQSWNVRSERIHKSGDC